MDVKLPKADNLKLETLKVLIGELSDDDKSSLLELIYKPTTEPDLDLLNFGDKTVENLSVANILRILRDIDTHYRTNFSARIYFTGDHDIVHDFDKKASYNEIGAIANCKLVGQVLIRLVRHYYRYPDEEDIEELLQDDKLHFEDVSQDFGGSSVGNFIKFLAFLESEFSSDYIITSEFTTGIYNRKGGTTIYETDNSKVDVRTIARLYSELYIEQIYDRKIVPNK